MPSLLLMAFLPIIPAKFTSKNVATKHTAKLRTREVQFSQQF
jgi:hypothetical protein